MTQTLQTRDYSIFKKLDSNREIYKPNLKKIINSMSMVNLLPFKPILVDEQMRVVDGQHRLRAAEELGLEVYYQINKSSSSRDIILMNANQKAWCKDDYLNFYANEGNRDYIMMKGYCERKSISVADFIKLIKGYRAVKDKLFQEGNMKFPEPSKIEEINLILERIKEIQDVIKQYFLISENNFIHSKKLKSALQLILDNPNIDYDLFLKKLVNKMESLRPCVSVPSYYMMLVSIYNYRNPNPAQ